MPHVPMEHSLIQLWSRHRGPAWRVSTMSWQPESRWTAVTRVTHIDHVDGKRRPYKARGPSLWCTFDALCLYSTVLTIQARLVGTRWSGFRRHKGLPGKTRPVFDSVLHPWL